jgi:hypothetical protein
MHRRPDGAAGVLRWYFGGTQTEALGDAGLRARLEAAVGTRWATSPAPRTPMPRAPAGARPVHARGLRQLRPGS